MIHKLNRKTKRTWCGQQVGNKYRVGEWNKTDCPICRKFIPNSYILSPSYGDPTKPIKVEEVDMSKLRKFFGDRCGTRENSI